MNLQFKNFSLRSLLVKIVAYAAIFYLVIIIASIAITGYIFLNLSDYSSRIEQTIYKHTGYKLQTGSIQTKLNNTYLPEIIIKDILLVNPVNKKQQLHIKSLDFVFSYTSIWDLEPVFNKIYIDGAEISVEYDPTGSIIVNGVDVNNPDKQTLENTKNSPIDVERWLLKQGSITLDHINLKYHDLKNSLPEMEFKNIKVGLEKHLWDNHRLYIDFFGRSYQNLLEAELSWRGGKFEHWSSWKHADLRVQSVNGENSLFSSLTQFIPGINSADKFNATTALKASMENGQLQDLSANFDVNNFQLALTDADLVNFPKLGGQLDIKLFNNSYYSIRANNLMVVTSAGYLFDNAKITGSYVVNKSGYLELSNTNLVAINNLLSVFDATDGMSIDGTINSVKYNWDGAFSKPSDYKLQANFHDISFSSASPDYPSLSHVSGDISVGKKQGALNLILQNSVFLYDKLFLIPYEFKSLNSKIDWSITSQNQLNIIMHKTDLETKDFKATMDGSYHNDPLHPDSSGYLAMNAHVDRVKTSKVGDYLPKSIPMSVHEWLNMGLAGGDGANANMILKGPLDSFPFQDGKGLFYITADVDNAKLQYVKDWPPLENVYGKFILKNTNITVKAASGRIQNNYLDPTLVVIPDYSAPDGVYLTADGHAHGSTANFMEYLKNTPINEIIGKLPEKITTTGDGIVKLYLKVPFKEPKRTEVKGTYSFENNSILFDLPVPELTAVNGDLGFSQHGVEISDLHANAFGSKANLYSTISKDGKMNFKVIVPSLNYQEVSKFYLRPFSGLVSGAADTEINFVIAKHGLEQLSAQSALRGVKLIAPEPLAKESSTTSSLTLNLTPIANDGTVINWQYGDALRGQQFFPAKGALTKGQIAVGNGTTYLSDADNSALITVNVNLATVDLLEWITEVNTVIKTIKQEKLINESGDLSALDSSAASAKLTGKKPGKLFLPIQVQVSSNQFKFGKIDLEAGSANVFADGRHTYFNMYTPIVSGMGDLIYAQDKLKLTLDKYMLFKKLNKLNSDSIESSHKINFVNGSDKVTKAKIPDIDLKIANLFYQNHSLGTLDAKLKQRGNDLLIESGSLSSSQALISFSAVNACFGCGRDASYVDFNASAKITNLGDLAYNLDLGRIIGNGRGTINASLQWNGGFQDFNILQTVGSINADISSGKFLQVDPGVLGGLMSIINLQGIFEFSTGDLQDIFKKGFFFNSLTLNVDILTSLIELKNMSMSGPMANVNSFGKANFANNSVDAYVSVAPKLGVVVALTAGVVTLNPLVGVAVYLGELVFGDPQNKLFTFGYHVTSSLKKPKVVRTQVTEQIVKNVNATVGN
ncbi:MAG: hypothetical protein K2X04_05085 [Burkholderiales bacterium]|nr:hypothetical protein [Burkholderiales bacterium]